MNCQKLNALIFDWYHYTIRKGNSKIYKMCILNSQCKEGYQLGKVPFVLCGERFFWVCVQKGYLPGGVFFDPCAELGPISSSSSKSL